MKQNNTAANGQTKQKKTKNYIKFEQPKTKARTGKVKIRVNYLCNNMIKI